uniref:Uncharacterized protein n=1 Tax=Desulfovibrio sp. U5L TaxID=596152 RepID=I2Q1F6_9BACT
MKLEAYVEPISGLTRLRDKETKRTFTRVVAGLCWPKGMTAGAVVALAEDVAADPVDGYRVLRLVDYEAHADVEQLLDLAAGVAPLVGEGAGRCAVSAWVGNPWHPFNKRLRHYNERLTGEGRQRINLRAAPGVGAGGQLLADLVPYMTARVVGRAALVLGRRDLIALVEDAGRDIRRHVEDFPAVAALLWAIAYCDERKPQVGRTETRSGTADSLAGY